MTVALRQIGDTYAAPDGVAYTLIAEAQLDHPARQETLATMSPSPSAPIVEEVLRSAGWAGLAEEVWAGVVGDDRRLGANGVAE